MKSKSLHFSPSGAVLPIASEIGRVHQCVCDKLPPAYPCDGDKLIFIGAEMDKKVPGEVEHFCRDLSPARTKNIAFYVVNGTGSAAALDSLRQELEAKGVHVAGEVLVITVKSSLFKKGKPTDEDVQKAIKWSQDVAAGELN